MSGRDLESGESTQVKGSGSAVYTLKNDGGVYSCTCPAWLHQNAPIDRRTCKHLRAFRGDAAETERLGADALPGKPVRSGSSSSSGGSSGAEEKGDAPPLLLAHSWDPSVDPSGWWMSEKLDGVRAFWNGEHFVSRLGNRFFAPEWFVEKLPKTPLDGELFGGRKRFQKTVGIVKRFDGGELWKELRFVVFDAPAHEGPFEARIDHCREVCSRAGEYASWHEHVVCRDVDHLREELARVEALGGEGLMMRRPQSRYEAGRSSSLLKVKTFFDAEAIVVGHEPGAGKHLGRLGALVLELENGTRFNVGSGFSDAERESPPPLGALVTFRYQELSDAGVPRFPTYVGVRIDGEWKGRAASTTSPAAIGAQRTVTTFERVRDGRREVVELEARGRELSVRQVTTFGADDALQTALEEAKRAALAEGFSPIGSKSVLATASGVEPATDGAPSGAKDDANESASKPTSSGSSSATSSDSSDVTPTPTSAATSVGTKSPSTDASAARSPSVPKPSSASAGKSTPSAPEGARRFELEEGTSSKFWEIELDGCDLTTRWGRIGSNGQSKTKTFASPEKARVEHDKLIAEKTGKGYAPA
jgi:DNA ligase-1